MAHPIKSNSMNSNTHPEDYLDHIDGLRAIAVLFVVFYHFGFEAFPGGFVGVDVFFVISGFLITRMILKEANGTGIFSFSAFYIRRARRILPALFFVLLISFIFSFLLLSPQHFQEFSGSLLHAVLSVSNFYFWSQAGYFDISSEFKPLLHTWSLGVEEQFYLIWPLLLVTLIRKSSISFLVFFILTTGAVSLILNILFADSGAFIRQIDIRLLSEFLPDGNATIFYLLPFRVFEFAIGSIMVWLVNYKVKNHIINEVFLITGLVMILYSVATYSTQTVFPSVHALIPAIGGALVIYSGRANYSGKIIRNKYMVNIGLWSYSLYLIHWPIFVFYKYYKYDSLVVIEKYALIFISIFISFLMYKIIEQPFRFGYFSGRKLSPGSYGLLWSLAAIVLVYPAANAWANSGWKFRINYSSISTEFTDLARNPEQFHINNYGGDRSRSYPHIDGESDPDMVLIGDSHARQYYEGLTTYSHDTKQMSFTSLANFSSCFYRLSECPDFEKALDHVVSQYGISTYVLGLRWDFKSHVKDLLGKSRKDTSIEELSDFYVNRISENLIKINNPNLKKIVVLGALPEIPNTGSLVTCLTRPLALNILSTCGKSKITESSNIIYRKNFNHVFSLKLHEVFDAKIEVVFFDPFDFLCDKYECNNLDPNNHKLLYSDNNHLSKYGSIVLTQKFWGWPRRMH